MAWDLIDLNDHPFLKADEGFIHKGGQKKVLYQSDTYHVWVHADEPGTKGVIHKHTADQTFFCMKGECTFTFPREGVTKVLTSGQLMVIPKGQLYQLHNTGNDALIMLGNRGEALQNPRFDPDDRMVED